MSARQLTGGCLCGACRFAVEASREAEICHCSMCRRWSGGIFVGTACGDTLRFEGGAPVRTYLSSDWGRRLFCGECGSSLAWQSADGTMTQVSVQALDESGDFELTTEIFIDEKPALYALAGERKTMTGAEVFAAFAPKAD